MSMTIQKLIIDSHETSASKGWWENPDRNIGELLALIHSEISEALEAVSYTHLTLPTILLV